MPELAGEMLVLCYWYSKKLENISPKPMLWVNIYYHMMPLFLRGILPASPGVVWPLLLSLFCKSVKGLCTLSSNLVGNAGRGCCPTVSHDSSVSVGLNWISRELGPSSTMSVITMPKLWRMRMPSWPRTEHDLLTWASPMHWQLLLKET